MKTDFIPGAVVFRIERFGFVHVAYDYPARPFGVSINRSGVATRWFRTVRGAKAALSNAWKKELVGKATR